MMVMEKVYSPILGDSYPLPVYIDMMRENARCSQRDLGEDLQGRCQKGKYIDNCFRMSNSLLLNGDYSKRGKDFIRLKKLAREECKLQKQFAIEQERYIDFL
jgi:hypothetical protein